MDKIRGKRGKYVPPRGLVYTGGTGNPQEFIQGGVHQLNLLMKHIDLQPADGVLDIGSGIGRTAIALVDHMNSNGFYEGFDVVETGVNWCNKKISKDNPNFNFKYVPLFNDLYNTQVAKASEYKFPYPDNHFDKIFSFSVFTHMQIEEIRNYLKESRRVLKEGGQCFSTFFIYDSENEGYIASNDVFSFPYNKDGYRLMDENVTSGNIAIQKERLQSMMREAGFLNVEIVEGFWKDAVRDTNKKEYQDMVVYS
ncbi:MAG: class I SAM-dependent methyltransferase [Flavobacteriaceae bacterium]|nr:class I SAM-dependent methyltransferase [Flavobacteriaceae bacterium]